MFFQGFDPETKSDDELDKMLSSLHHKLIVAATYSSSGDMVGQIQQMIQSIDMVRMDRIKATMFNSRMKAQKEIIESDPLLAVSGEDTSPKEKARPRKPMNKMVVQRSTLPSNQIK